MARIRTLDFLPEIFKTATNTQFLSATIDQLVSKPQLRKIDGFVGQQSNKKETDNYLLEGSKLRNDYQLEPATVFVDEFNNARDLITYPEIIDSLRASGANIDKHDRLWSEELYSWDSFVDLDKLVNFSQYYWLPFGPDAVDVFASTVSTTDSFDMISGPWEYTTPGNPTSNPTITLARGGHYTFNINQQGSKFWLQTNPGVEGTKPYQNNVSSRDIFGVSNNGIELGEVTFFVPQKDAQNFYLMMDSVDPVNYATSLHYDQINNKPVDAFLLEHNGIDGQNDLVNKTLIIFNEFDDGWTQVDTFADEAFDTQVFAEEIPLAERTFTVWNIEIYNNGGDDLIRLTPKSQIPLSTKVLILAGKEHGNLEYFRTSDSRWEKVPVITALDDILYYQDGTDPDKFGVIKLVDSVEVVTLDVTDIIGKDRYTSPNGVAFSNGMKVIFRGEVFPTSYTDRSYYVEGVGDSIVLIDETLLVTPERYTRSKQAPYDSALFDASTFDAVLNSPQDPDYLTVNRASIDGNPWSRGNRWVHVDVINASAQYNNTIPLINQDLRAQRPIIEYRKNLRLYNYGTKAKLPIDVIDTTQTDAFSNVNGAPDYLVDGVAFAEGMRVIFAADTDVLVRNKIYEVTFIDPDGEADPFEVIGYTVDGITDIGGIAIVFHPGDVVTISGVGQLTVRKDGYYVFDSEVGFSGNVPKITLEIRNVTQTLTVEYIITCIQPAIPAMDIGVAFPSSPADGALFYREDLSKMYVYDGSAWVEINETYFYVSLHQTGSTYENITLAAGTRYGRIINLIPAPDSEVLLDETVVVRNGLAAQGNVYYYNGDEWIFGQQKTEIGQGPLIEVYDINGHMYSDNEYYPGTSFRGAELFNYMQQAGGKMDPILKIRLKYATFNNVGDILFKSALQNDEFVYVDGNKSITKSIRNSFVREYTDRTTYDLRNGWTKHIVNDVTYQKFVVTYTGDVIKLDVVPRVRRITPVKILVNGNFASADKYTLTVGEDNTIITLVGVDIGAIVEIQILSDQASKSGFYQVPKNLERNPFNDDPTSLTLGLIREHYAGITRNHPELIGDAIGANNTRDLGNIAIYGDTIVKHSSLVSLASVFLRGKKYDFFGAIDWAGIEYEKFKSFIISNITENDYGFDEAATILDKVIESYTVNKTEESPFYYADMIPHGVDYIETKYTISAITSNVFDTVYTYDFTKSNHSAILIYLNGELLLKDIDYVVADDGPRVTISVSLTNDDVIVVREYATTVGSCVPVTPTKMGMYELYEPRLVVDTSYSTPQQVLRGHDGSAMIAFGDVRDLVLLEYEKRVYNNHKGTKYVPLIFADVIPGAFRKTEYDISEIDSILNPMFLRWASIHHLDYTTQDYDEHNEFTWNYSKTASKLDETLLDGGWRAVYRHYYDTDTPHQTPWEMVGLTEMPAWWEERYGPAPYTKNNLVLWDDMEAGIIADPMGYRVDDRFRRPGLTKVLPVDDQGALVSPYVSIVKFFDIRLTKGEWTSGDGGPVETAWYRSSVWPFAMQKLLALTKPASYFSLYIDKDRYHYDDALLQFMMDGNSPLRLDAINLADTKPAHSFINYIIDYNKVIGRSNVAELTYDLEHIDVRLAYRMAGYSDKKYLKVIVEKTSPNNDSNNLIMPDENFSLLLHDNEIQDQIVYSAVIVQKTKNGYKVYGTDESTQFFSIFKSVSFGKNRQVQGIVDKITLPVEFDYNTLVQIPYGTEFLNKSTVVDFLISYSKYLEHKGLRFESVIDGTEIGWIQVAEEFAYWCEQGWEEGAIIQLNPSAVEIKLSSPGAVVAGLQNYARDNYVLNQNNRIMQHKDLVVTRIGNEFTVNPIDGIVAFAKMNLISYEHVLLLDNKTVFNDIIYDLATGSRQLRVKLVGYKTGQWDGSLHADGFIVATSQPEEWKRSKVYRKGDVVLFKGKSWVATDNIQPSDKFDYAIWTLASLNTSNQLLQNINTKAGMFEDFYSTQAVNLEQDVGVLGRGLIGYRPREYMSNLFTDDTSQFQLYSNFIPVKGTPLALDKIRNISLDKESSDYQVYENWAIKLSEYGATDSKGFIEATLSGQAGANPYTVQITANNFTTSEADEVIPISNLYDHNLERTDVANIFSTTYSRDYETTLPTAGYVNINDADIAVFDIKNLTELRNKIDLVEDGAIVWIAKTNDVNWGVYKVTTVNPTIAAITNNYDGTSTLTFKTPHTLAKNEIIIIKYFEGFNGAYNVLSVTNQFNVVIDYKFPEQSQIATYPGNGVLFKLRTVRVGQASDIADLSYINKDGDLVWVDDINGYWEVLQKQSPWKVSQDTLTAIAAAENMGFGTVVGASSNGTYVLTGNPSNNTISTFVRVDTGELIPNSEISINLTGLSSLGKSLEVGGNEWSVAGAPASDSNKGYALVLHKDPASRLIEIKQVLVPNDTRSSGDIFGQAVTISSDERWIYVGAPGARKVYAYGLVRVEPQLINRLADGTNKIRVDDKIQLSPTHGAFQLDVSVNDAEYVLNTDWQYVTDADGSYVVFTVTPEVGARVSISRKQQLTYKGGTHGNQTMFDIRPLALAKYTDSVTVFVDGIIQRPYVDYTLPDNGTDIIFTYTVTSGKNVLIYTSDHYRYVGYINNPEPTEITSYFGASLSTTTDGRQLFIGAPLRDVTHIDDGRVYVFDRVVEKFVADGASTVFNINTHRTIVKPNRVKVNNTFAYDSEIYLDGQYTASAASVTFVVPPDRGTLIEIETNNFLLVTSASSSSPRNTARLGYDVKVCPDNCSFYASAPFDSSTYLEAGSVVRFINNGREYGILDGTPTAIAAELAAREAALLAGVPRTDVDVDILAVVTIGNALRINNVEVVFTSNTLPDVVNIINNSNVPNVKAYSRNGKLTIALINTTRDQLSILPGYTATSTTSALDSLGLVVFQESQRITSPHQEVSERFGYKLSISPDGQTLAVSTPTSNVIKHVTIDGGITTFDSKATLFNDRIRQTGTVYLYELLQASVNTVATPKKLVFAQQIDAPMVTPFDQFGEGIELLNDLLFVGAPLDDLAGENTGTIFVFDNPNRESAWKVFRNEEPRVDTSLIKAVTLVDKNTGQIKNYLDFVDPLNGKIFGVVRANIDYITFVDPAQYNSGSTNIDGYTWAAERVGEVWWDLTNLRYIDYYQSSISFKAKRWAQLFPGSSVDVYEWVESDVPPEKWIGDGTPKNTQSYTVLSKNVLGMIVPKYYFWVKNVSSVNRQRNKTLSAAALASYIENAKASGIAYAAILENDAFALYNASEYLDDDTVVRIDYDIIAAATNVHTEYELIRAGDPDSYLSPSLLQKMTDSLTGVDVLGNRVPGVGLSEARSYGIKFRPRQSMFKDRKTALRTFIDRVNKILKWYPIVGNKNLERLRVSDVYPAEDSGAWDIKLANLSELSYQNLAILSVGTRFLVEVDNTNNNRWSIYELKSDRSLSLIGVQSFDTNNYWQYIDWYKDEVVAGTKVVKTIDYLTDLPKQVVRDGDIVKVRYNLSNVWELHQFKDSQWTCVGIQNGTIRVLGDIFDSAVARVGFDAEVFDIQYFDQEPITEIRFIIDAVNNDLLIDDLSLARNELLVLMFNYIIAEQPKVDWLIKTSLVDVTHKIRTLDQFGIYRRDNQEFVLDYINEVKPYHVQVKDFTLEYNTIDTYDGEVTDFDVPVYYDTNTGRFVAPHVGVEDPSFWQQPLYRDWANNHLFSIDNIIVVNQGEGYTVPPEIIIEGDCAEPATARAKINSAGRLVAIVLLTPGLGYSNTPVIRINGGNGTGAMAVAKLKTPLVRSIKTIMKFDRVDYTDSIIDWMEGIELVSGELVRYQSHIFRVAIDHVSSSHFDVENFESVDQANLNAADRVMGYYTPGPGQVGKGLSLVERGIVYPGVQVLGLGFDQNPGFDRGSRLKTGYDVTTTQDQLYRKGIRTVGLSPLYRLNELTGEYDVIIRPTQMFAPSDWVSDRHTGGTGFDSTPFDVMIYGPEGYPTVDESQLDSTIESAYLDSYLGTRPEDINVGGGAYVDEYSSHGPEELVTGRVFDTLDLEVYTRPGWDYLGEGIGPDIRVATKSYVAVESNDVVSFADYMLYPAAVKVFSTRLQALTEGVHYTVDWRHQTVTSLITHNPSDKLLVYIYGIAGGNKIFESNYNATMTVNNVVGLPVDYYEIKEVIVVKNGIFLTSSDYTFYNNDPFTSLEFNDALAIDDYVYVVVQGNEYINHGITTLRTVNFVTTSTSYPNGYQYTLPFTIDSAASVNAVVELNGKRLRGSAGIRHVRNSGRQVFQTVDVYQLGYPASTVADNEIMVFVNNEHMLQTVHYEILDPMYGYETRDVSFIHQLNNGDIVDIYVTRGADYRITNGNELLIAQTVPLSINDKISVSVYGEDYSQLRALTYLYKGPRNVPVISSSNFDAVGFGNDLYDQFVVDSQQANRFDLRRIDSLGFDTVPYDNDMWEQEVIDNAARDGGRLWVTVNGNRLHHNIDYVVVGTEVVIQGQTLAPDDIIMITAITPNIGSISTGYRYFKDLQDSFRAYRLDKNFITELAQPLAITDTEIFVKDAHKLPSPNLPAGVFGSIMIGAEKIYYRERDTVNNVLRGLRRGVGGTGAAEYYDMNERVFDTSINQVIEASDYVFKNVYAYDKADVEDFGPSTVITYPLRMGATEIYVDDASVLDLPTTASYIDSNGTTIEYSVPAVMIVGNEKIYYTAVDTATNIVSGLKRDQSGVGAYYEHLVGTGVYGTTHSSTTNGTWYQIDTLNSKPSDGVPLQVAATPQAVFIREHGVVLPR